MKNLVLILSKKEEWYRECKITQKVPDFMCKDDCISQIRVQIPHNKQHYPANNGSI